ncbi:hypothetical protein [Nocardioides jishulii]|uniref:Uncharacterized protein n=1 Tax=Nocardioides jishulii TaxID=2575440 RepID=A0A4U2YPX5_9ACTN|nr:hypothetical protein [Nocardioides jishulii]QCX27919.1 hypothetical protein FCL41_10595 [Nocardioides jishulii]TKI62725.1 hypothetical protein FC770_10260 [Nocardioides jishulii]
MSAPSSDRGDLAAGAVVTHPVTLTPDLVSDLVARGGYTHPLFDVATHGEETPLPGQGVLLLAGGLVEQCGILDDAVAMLELKSVRFARMVRAGDDLRVRVVPGPWRVTSKGTFVQEFAWTVLTGAGAAAEAVAYADVVMLMNQYVEGA